MATPGVSSIVLPTGDPTYYLRFDTDPRAGTSASILLPTGEVLLKEPVQDPKAQDKYRTLDIDQRQSRLKGKKLFLFAGPQLLVLIPSGDNRLLTLRIALRDALARLDRSIVVSPSDVFATAGQTFSHQIRVLPKAGGVTFSKSRVFPPADIAVSEDGKVTWSVPSTPAAAATNVLIRVNDATGRQYPPHRLNILVR
jgi:hypothetical protein